MSGRHGDVSGAAVQLSYANDREVVKHPINSGAVGKPCCDWWNWHLCTAYRYRIPDHQVIENLHLILFNNIFFSEL